MNQSTNKELEEEVKNWLSEGNAKEWAEVVEFIQSKISQAIAEDRKNLREYVCDCTPHPIGNHWGDSTRKELCHCICKHTKNQ